MDDYSFDVHIFRERDAFVAYVPSLDVLSCGGTGGRSRHNIRDAVRGFLDKILQEAG